MKRCIIHRLFSPVASMCFMTTTDGEKVPMFSVNGGSDADGFVGDLQKGKIYIIVETTEKCREGQFKFEIMSESGN